LQLSHKVRTFTLISNSNILFSNSPDALGTRNTRLTRIITKPELLVWDYIQICEQKRDAEIKMYIRVRGITVKWY
jgi:hypothetical protein